MEGIDDRGKRSQVVRVGWGLAGMLDALFGMLDALFGMLDALFGMLDALIYPAKRPRAGEQQGLGAAEGGSGYPGPSSPATEADDAPFGAAELVAVLAAGEKATEAVHKINSARISK